MKKLSLVLVSCFVACLLVACDSRNDDVDFSDSDINSVENVTDADGSAYAVYCTDQNYHSRWYSWDCWGHVGGNGNASYCHNEFRAVSGRWCNSDYGWRQACWNLHPACRVGSWYNVWGMPSYNCGGTNGQSIFCRCLCQRG